MSMSGVMARAACPICGRITAVRADGRLRMHRNPLGEPCNPTPAEPPEFAADLDPETSKWLRIFAANHYLSLSEATTYLICQGLGLPVPAGHPLAEEDA